MTEQLSPWVEDKKMYSHHLTSKLRSEHLTTTIAPIHDHLRQTHAYLNYNWSQLYKIIKYNIVYCCNENNVIVIEKNIVLCEFDVVKGLIKSLEVSQYGKYFENKRDVV